jgi:hypothetical protein
MSTQDARPSSDHTLPPSPRLKPSSSRDSIPKIPSDAPVTDGTGEKASVSPKESTILTGKKLAVVFIAMLVSNLAVVDNHLIERR